MQPLIPQFSIRFLLGVITLLALVFWVMSMALRNHGWALAISFGLISLCVLLVVFAAAFLVIAFVGNSVSAVARKSSPPVVQQPPQEG